MKDLRCYCCGDAIGVEFDIVSMGRSVDRVFIMKSDHSARTMDARTIIRVRRVRKPPMKAKR